MLRVTVAIFSVLFMTFWTAQANIASQSYVLESVSSVEEKIVQPDFAQTDSTAGDFIKNKPDLSAVEQTTNKVTTISDASTDTQYPSAAAVKTALDTKADADDVRFQTIPTTEPTGTPPSGQVFVWFN